MNTPPTFRATLEDLNRPALTILPPDDPRIPARTMPANVRRLLPPVDPLLAKIDGIVSTTYGVPVNALHGACRSRAGSTAAARQIAMFLARELTPLTLSEIGRRYGRDHGTVLHAIRTVSGYSDVYPKIRAALAELRRRIQEAP